MDGAGAGSIDATRSADFIRRRVGQMLLVLIAVATLLLALQLASGDAPPAPTRTPAPVVFPTQPRT